MVHDDQNEESDDRRRSLKLDDLLSFKSVGRIIAMDDIPQEFSLMKDCLKGELTAVVARRICEKSGSHLLKLVSPRVDGEHAVLRFDDPSSNRRSTILPSTNAPDIPFCKVVFRPLEVRGHSAMSVIDHILNPEEYSDQVLSAFASVFGDDVLDAMQDVLLSPPKTPLKLGAGEFPIIFIPCPGGGDLQITPVSPATTFMGMKRVTDHYFQKAQPDGPRPPRGRWTRQAISAKPQNISGFIGGPRVRFLATMPPGMLQEEAELHRFVHGGNFPRWHDPEVTEWVLRYADMLDADGRYNNIDTRAALDRTADRLIKDAAAFIQETLDDAQIQARKFSIEREKLPSPPSIQTVLIRRRWKNDETYGRAKNALTSPHFEHRARKLQAAKENMV